MIESEYRTPDGYVDMPFFYVFDGRTLTPGSSPEGLITEIREHDFLLRSVVGLSTVAGQWRYYNPSQAPAMSNLATTTPRFTVAPEKHFPFRSGIELDLGVVALATNVSGNPVSFIGYQGVRRYHEGQIGWSVYKTAYQYWERPFTYRFTLTLNFFADVAAGTAPRKFQVPITDEDFELQTIAIRRTDVDSALLADTFLVNFYDPSGYNALSTEPVPARWLNGNQPGNFFSAWPAPTMVWPVDSAIVFEITSLLDAADGPHTYEITFQGVKRMPC